MIWRGSEIHDDNLLTGGTTGSGYNYKVYTQGIYLAGSINQLASGGVLRLEQNRFDTSDVTLHYASDAVLVDSRDLSDLSLGVFGSSITFVGDEAHNLFEYVRSDDFGFYADNNAYSDEYGALMVIGDANFDVFYEITTL